MKVSRLLIIAALFTGACSEEDAADQATQQSYAAVAQAPEPASTTSQAQPKQNAPPEKRPAPPTAPKDATVPATAAAPKVNADAAVLQDFNNRVQAYLTLRKEAVKDAPKLKETKDPAQIKAAQDGMAANIRKARAGAKQGDVFTPQVVAQFRRLLYPELKGDDGRDAKEIIKEDAPTNVPFKVNAKYPDGAPVPTVPANLLINLPTLPEPLQYRIIDRHLILLDEDADVILDYALNVIR